MVSVTYPLGFIKVHHAVAKLQYLKAELIEFWNVFLLIRLKHLHMPLWVVHPRQMWLINRARLALVGFPYWVVAEPMFLRIYYDHRHFPGYLAHHEPRPLSFTAACASDDTPPFVRVNGK